MKLEDLVPPLELCKKIPEGRFEDSVFVWVDYQPKFQIVDKRKYPFIPENGATPAPTLQEIMEEISFFDDLRVATFRYMYHWTVEHEDIFRDDPKNPATAALKLWLKLKGVEE